MRSLFGAIFLHGMFFFSFVHIHWKKILKNWKYSFGGKHTAHINLEYRTGEYLEHLVYFRFRSILMSERKWKSTTKKNCLRKEVWWWLCNLRNFINNTPNRFAYGPFEMTFFFYSFCLLVVDLFIYEHNSNLCICRRMCSGMSVESVWARNRNA